MLLRIADLTTALSAVCPRSQDRAGNHGDTGRISGHWSLETTYDPASRSCRDTFSLRLIMDGYGGEVKREETGDRNGVQYSSGREATDRLSGRSLFSSIGSRFPVGLCVLCGERSMAISYLGAPPSPFAWSASCVLRGLRGFSIVVRDLALVARMDSRLARE